MRVRSKTQLGLKLNSNKNTDKASHLPAKEGLFVTSDNSWATPPTPEAVDDVHVILFLVQSTETPLRIAWKGEGRPQRAAFLCLAALFVCDVDLTLGLVLLAVDILALCRTRPKGREAPALVAAFVQRKHDKARRLIEPRVI